MAPRPGDFDDNTAVWLEGAPESAPEPALGGDAVADVVIIGGGFTGLSTAWHLIERFPDRRVVILEARAVANGASGRNGGQLLHWINGVGYGDPDLVRRVYEVTDRGIRWVERMISEHGLPVRHRMDGTLELVTDARRAEEAQQHAERLQGWGVPVRWLGRGEVQATLGMEGVVGGVLDPHTGVLNGVDFLRGLKSLLLARGVVIHEGTPALKVVEGATIAVETPGGTLRAPALVLATNGYTPRLGYFKSHLFAMQSHVVATAPASAETWAGRGWAGAAAFSDDLDRIAYGGLTPDGRLVFGGGSNASYSYLYGGRTGVIEGAHAAGFRAVEARLRGYWPRVPADAISHRWSGPLGITLNRQCVMGVRGAHRNVYYALGYSGHGVALANLAGEVLCDLYSDHHEPWADLPFYKNPPLYIPPEPLRWVGYHVVAGLTGKSPRRHS